MIRKLACFLVASSLAVAAFSANYDLVPAGDWNVSVDKTSSVEPAEAAGLAVTQGGRKAIVATFKIAPDKDNGGKEWSWGDLAGHFLDGKKGVDLGGVSEIKVTYSADGPFVLAAFMVSGVPDEGGEHVVAIPSTGGEEKTISVAFKNFKQPSWAKRKALSTKAIKWMAFQPAMPKGGTATIKLFNVEFVGLDASAVKK